MDYKIDKKDFLRILSFQKNCELNFASSKYIKDFETFNLVLYIYSKQYLLGENVRFSDLQKFTKRSDVYLANLIKEGLLARYLDFEICPTDKRRKHYFVMQPAISFMNSLKEFDDYLT